MYVISTWVRRGIYNLKSTPNDKFFWEQFSWQFFIYSQPFFFWHKSVESHRRQRNIFFIFRFIGVVWSPGQNLELSSNKPIYYDNCRLYSVRIFMLSSIPQCIISYQKKPENPSVLRNCLSIASIHRYFVQSMITYRTCIQFYLGLT